VEPLVINRNIVTHGVYRDLFYRDVIKVKLSLMSKPGTVEYVPAACYLT
jgi:hypothetical protein